MTGEFAPVESSAGIDHYGAWLEAGTKYQFTFDYTPTGHRLELWRNGEQVNVNNPHQYKSANAAVSRWHHYIPEETGLYYVHLIKGSTVTNDVKYTLGLKEIPFDEDDDFDNDFSADASTEGRVLADGTGRNGHDQESLRRPGNRGSR